MQTYMRRIVLLIRVDSLEGMVSTFPSGVSSVECIVTIRPAETAETADIMLLLF